MKVPFKERTISTAVVIPSAIIVAALAVLQYRWSTRISEATAVRLADSLQMSMMNWQKDFFRYFSEIGLALRIDPVEDAPGDVGQYVRRFAEWKAVAKYPKLVSDVYLLKSDAAARPQALRLNSPARRFEPDDWPAQFEPLRQDLRRASAEFLRNRASQEPYELFDMGDPSAGWRFDPGIPALFHPVVLGSVGEPEAVDWIAIELSRQEIQSRILSDLSRTYFQGTDGLDYLVAVVPGTRPAACSTPPILASATRSRPTRTGPSIYSAAFKTSPWVRPCMSFMRPPDNKGPDASVKISWFPFLREHGGGSGLAIGRKAPARRRTGGFRGRDAAPRSGHRLWRAAGAGDQYGDADRHQSPRPAAGSAPDGFCDGGFA